MIHEYKFLCQTSWKTSCEQNNNWYYLGIYVRYNVESTNQLDCFEGLALQKMVHFSDWMLRFANSGQVRINIKDDIKSSVTPTLFYRNKNGNRVNVVVFHEHSCIKQSQSGWSRSEHKYILEGMIFSLVASSQEFKKRFFSEDFLILNWLDGIFSIWNVPSKLSQNLRLYIPILYT